jgi:hypothetical protein
MTVLRNEGAFILRSLDRLQDLYLRLKGSGLRDALPAERDMEVSDRLKELIEEMRQLEQALDWELTGEIIRLKDLAKERAAQYAKLRYGLAVGLPLTVPTRHPDLPDLMRVQSIGFADEPSFEILVEGVPVRPDGTELSVTVQVLVGPKGVKVWVPGTEKRDQLRLQLPR